MVIKLRFDPVKALHDFVKAPVQISAKVFDSTIQIVKPLVLSDNSQKEPDQDGQRHLNERLLNEARRVQSAFMIAKRSLAPVRQY